MSKTILLVIIAECWMIMGQICFKKSADRLTIEGTNQKPWIMQLLASFLRFPMLWVGAAAMMIGLLFWFAALSSGDLNYVYLLSSIQYVIALIAAHFFLHEKIDTPKMIGTLLIMLGIILTAVS